MPASQSKVDMTIRSWFGDKKPCFRCCQQNNLNPTQVILQSNKGYLCFSCSQSINSPTIQRAVNQYRLDCFSRQPTDDSIDEQLMSYFSAGLRLSTARLTVLLRDTRGFEPCYQFTVEKSLARLVRLGLLATDGSTYFNPLHFM